MGHTLLWDTPFCGTHTLLWDTPFCGTHPFVGHTHLLDTPICWKHPFVGNTHLLDTPFSWKHPFLETPFSRTQMLQALFSNIYVQVTILNLFHPYLHVKNTCTTILLDHAIKHKTFIYMWIMLVLFKTTMYHKQDFAGKIFSIGVGTGGTGGTCPPWFLGGGAEGGTKHRALLYAKFGPGLR